MAYLDVSPMTTALRTMPDQFELDHGWLHHIPSRHRFQFDAKGRVQIVANCNCCQLAVSSEQEPELYASFQQWRTNYWRPYEINEEFASHFQQPSRFRKLMIGLTARVHHWLISGIQPRPHEARDRSAIGA